MHIFSEHNIEIPPPLPPRRRLKHSNTNPDIDEIKQKRSAWNIIDNVFGRHKKSELHSQSKQIPIALKRNGFMETSSCPIRMDHLSHKQNSFSSPDLTNISSSYNRIDLDDNDLEIMDIERSNSLNSATNQFLCRLPSLNISSNILWSHNLSSNLSSCCDTSAVNLVGANVNAEHYLTEDVSGYCKMVADQNVSLLTVDGQSTHVHVKPVKPSRVIEDISGYCQMAPIFNDISPKDVQKSSRTDTIVKEASLEISCHDEDSISLLDYSLISNDKHSSSRGSCHDENSSSGVSSDEGAIYAHKIRMRSASLQSVKPSLKLDIEHDDAISMTFTESPTSSISVSPHNNNNKLDEKYPSYYPNHNIYNSPLDVKKNSSSNITKSPIKNQNISGSSNGARRATTVKCFTRNVSKKQQIKKSKQRIEDNSLDKEQAAYDENNHFFKEPARPPKIKSKKTSLRNGVQGAGEKAIVEPKTNVNKFKSKNHSRNSADGKSMSTNGLEDGNMKSTRSHKSTKLSKHIHTDMYPKTPPAYHKSLSFSNATPVAKSHRLASLKHSSPATASCHNFIGPDDESVPEECILNTSSSKGNDFTGSILRFASLTRFRKIDFSPLKVKFTNILQRQNPEI